MGKSVFKETVIISGAAVRGELKEERCVRSAIKNEVLDYARHSPSDWLFVAESSEKLWPSGTYTSIAQSMLQIIRIIMQQL